MYLIIMLGMFVFRSFCVSVCMLTVSKACDKSSDVMMVRLGGLFVLKPFAIVLLMLCRAVVVECCV